MLQMIQNKFVLAKLLTLATYHVRKFDHVVWQAVPALPYELLINEAHIYERVVRDRPRRGAAAVVRHDCVSFIFRTH